MIMPDAPGDSDRVRCHLWFHPPAMRALIIYGNGQAKYLLIYERCQRKKGNPELGTLNL